MSQVLVMKISLLIITRRQKIWKKFQIFRDDCFSRIVLFISSSAWCYLSSHSWREKGLVCTPCRLPVLPGGRNSYTVCSFLQERFSLLAFLLCWCAFSTSQLIFLVLLTPWSLPRATSSTGSAQILSRPGEGRGLFQSWNTCKGRNGSATEGWKCSFFSAKVYHCRSGLFRINSLKVEQLFTANT